MTRPDLRRALDQIKRVAARGHDVNTFFTATGEVLHDAVPSGMEDHNLPYWYTVDPESLLITSVVGSDCEMSVADMMRFEYVEDDVNKVSEVLHNHRGIQTLHEVTDGDPYRSRAFRDYSSQIGVGHEAVVALRSRNGWNWGAVRLVRGQDRPGFNPPEVEFLRAASRWLAAGARRGLMIGQARDPEGEAAPGMVVIAPDLTVSSISPTAERLLADLADWSPGNELPVAVLAVASRIAQDRSGTADDVEARVRSRSGIWTTVHAVPLSGAEEGTVGVIVERAHPARILPLLMDLYELTLRERDVTGLVLQGLSTTQIAEKLFLSPYTVQQHLKKAFSKTGTRNRGELVSNVFYDAYDPRVTDNGERQLLDLPIRGGPLARRDAKVADGTQHLGSPRL
jgi:DNA-binding CsgD family transcriptional regulator